jgi:hypothetical protein
MPQKISFPSGRAVVPKSRVRQKSVYTPPTPKTAKRKVSPSWVGPGIVVGLLVGLAWIVVYYAANPPGMSTLGAWNLVIGFGFIIGAVILATTWH